MNGPVADGADAAAWTQFATDQPDDRSLSAVTPLFGDASTALVKGEPTAGSPAGGNTACDPRLRPARAPAAGDEWRTASGRFTMRAVLGHGGMGTVLLAEQIGLGREVALKTVRIDQDQDQRRELFADETRIAARLNHPSIVPVHDAGEGVLVMRRVRGSSWQHALTPGVAVAAERLPIEIQRVVKVCDAIRHAHDQGVIHRDLKPANIMVGNDGEVLVMDWGLALLGATDDAGRWRSPALTKRIDRALAGTPAWISPEAARGDSTAIGPAVDAFAIGAILQRLLDGSPAWPADSTAMGALVRAAAGGAARALPDAPPILVQLAHQCLRDDPAQRPTITAIATRLRDWLARSDLERRARALAQQSTHADNLPERLRLADEAHELDPDQPDVRRARIAAVQGTAAAALVAEDFLRARAALDRLAITDDDAGLRARLALGERRRRRQRAWQRWALVASATVIALCLGLGWMLIHDLNQADRRASSPCAAPSTCLPSSSSSSCCRSCYCLGCSG